MTGNRPFQYAFCNTTDIYSQLAAFSVGDNILTRIINTYINEVYGTIFFNI